MRRPVTLEAVRDGGDVLVTTFLAGEAFALDGRALETQQSPGGLRVHDAPDRFLVVAYVLFGPENAEAVVLDSPGQWFVDVAPAPGPAAPVDPPVAAPARAAPELADTGSAAADTANLALALLVAGCACVVLSRRGSGRRHL